MRGRSTATRAMGRAMAVAAYSRRSGCPIDEAAEALDAEVLATGARDGGVLDAGAPDIGRLKAGDLTVRGAGPSEPMPRRAFLGALGAAGLATLPRYSALGGRLPQPSPISPETRRGGTGDHGRVVIVGAGIAGLGCAAELWRSHRIPSEVYEYNSMRAGGRIFTLHGYFDAGQYAEQHGEFISSEHTEMRRLVSSLGLVLDDTNRYPPGTRPSEYRMRFGDRFFPQAALDREWHEWAWELFHDAAFRKAPWPTIFDQSTPTARKWDHTPATEWIDEHVQGGLHSDFGRLCVAVLLDEYGGDVEVQSALNLVYLLGLYDSVPSGRQPKGAPQLSGSDEKWHVRGGNDQVITGLLHRLPPGTVHLNQELVALRGRSGGGFTCTFSDGSAHRDVTADHVVLALPFTKLREVELLGIDLPARQLAAIRTEPLGENSKIQLQFSTRVWNSDHWTGNMYTDGIVQGGWEATVDQPGTPGILIALPGGAEGGGIGRRYALSNYFGPAPAAMVDDFLGGFEVNFPGSKAAYAGKAYYAWSSGDPHILGAYSYLKVGQYSEFNGIQGRATGNLHFAGEHTSLNFQGYMEGALRSGHRCAGEIAALAT